VDEDASYVFCALEFGSGCSTLGPELTRKAFMFLRKRDPNYQPIREYWHSG
jgi:hypothetical protein